MPDLKRRLAELDDELKACLTEVYTPISVDAPSSTNADIRNSIVEKFGFYRYESIQEAIKDYHDMVKREQEDRAGLKRFLECKAQREQYEKEKAEELAKNPPPPVVKLGRWQRFRKAIASTKFGALIGLS